MLLFNTFTALRLHEPYAQYTEATLQHYSAQDVTATDLNDALRKKTAAYRSLAYDAPEGTRAGTRQALYDDFLRCVESTLKEQPEAPLEAIILTFLKAHPELSQLRGFAEERAKDALATAPLASALIDQPQAFASFLGWLMVRGVTANEILATHIVQLYFRYHFLDIDEPNHPIQVLAATLAKKPVTQALAKQLSITCCADEALSCHALDGHIDTSGQLKNFGKEPLEPAFYDILSDTAFQTLEGRFGGHFLLYALKHIAHTRTLLEDFFASPKNTERYIPELLRYLKSAPALRIALASCLSDNVFDRLLAEHTSGLLVLLPHAPYLKSRIREMDITSYPDELKQHAQYQEDLITDLSQLLSLVKDDRKRRSVPVCRALIEALLESPSFMQDDAYITLQLRLFKPAKAILTEKLLAIEAELDATIQDNLAPFDYINIQDAWARLRPRANMIQNIEQNLPFSFPLDKRELQSLIAHQLFKQNKAAFSLDSFVEALRITPTFNPEYITSYERLLINVLVTIDDDALRQNIIQRLDAHMSETKNWRDSGYIEKSLTKLACKNGNLGLIQWLKSENIKSSKSLCDLALTAARAHHWDVVNYYHQTSTLQGITVKQLLDLAVEQNEPQAISALWQEGKAAPLRPNVEDAFKKAVQQNAFECVQALRACPTPPCDTIIINGFKQAVQDNNFLLTTQIAEAVENPMLQEAINDMLPEATRTNKLDLLQCLGALRVNPLQQVDLDKALMSGVRAGHLGVVQTLCEFEHLSPRPDAKANAFDEARKMQRAEIIEFLADAARPRTPVQQKSRHNRRHKEERANGNHASRAGGSPLPTLSFFYTDNERHAAREKRAAALGKP